MKIVEDGVLLRPWRDADADGVHRACQDRDIQRWTTVPRPYRPEHARDFVTGVSARAWADGTGAPFAVCDGATGDLLGSCGLVWIDDTGTGEVGYWVAPWARGRGVSVRATRAMARWSFEKLGLRRLLWQAEIGNHASRLVALRAGFQIDGRVRLANPAPDGRADGWIGSLLPGEVPEPGSAGPAARGTLAARRAAVFGRPQPVLFATAASGELRLRPMEERDLDAVAQTCRDPETVRWTTVPDPYELSDAHGYRTFVQDAWARGDAACFVIADADDRYAGTLDLRLSSADPLLADVGFMVAPAVRGRGYLPAALLALSAWGFTTLGLARIEWKANVGNTSSRRAAEKAGFRFEGTLRGGVTHRGERVDTWLAALLAEDLT